MYSWYLLECFRCSYLSLEKSQSSLVLCTYNTLQEHTLLGLHWGRVRDRTYGGSGSRYHYHKLGATPRGKFQAHFKFLGETGLGGHIALFVLWFSSTTNPYWLNLVFGGGDDTKENERWNVERVTTLIGIVGCGWSVQQLDVICRGFVQIIYWWRLWCVTYHIYHASGGSNITSNGWSVTFGCDSVQSRCLREQRQITTGYRSLWTLHRLFPDNPVRRYLLGKPPFPPLILPSFPYVQPDRSLLLPPPHIFLLSSS